MLVLLFDLDSDRYALDARQVVEIMPLVRMKQIPQPPRGVAGVLNYRGTPVPVIDLTELTLGRPSSDRLSTRLIIVEYPAEQSSTRLLGLIAEHATETMRRPDHDFVDSGITIDEAKYLGPIATDTSGMIQLVDISRLLPSSLRDALYGQAAEP